jgi:hypothetical protein
MVRTMERGGETPGRWRCSPDLARELWLAQTLEATVAGNGSVDDADSFRTYVLRAPWGTFPAGTRIIAPPESFMGLPVAVDESLPPNGLILEALHSPLHSPDRR